MHHSRKAEDILGHDQPTEFVPLQMGASRQAAAAQRASMRRVTIAFAILAPVASWLAVFLAVYPEASIPLWARGAMIVPWLLMAFAGIWLVDSVRWGHRLSITSLACAVGVVGAMVVELPDLDRVAQAELALSILLPSVVLMAMTRHLMRLRRSAMLKPLF